MRPPRQLLSLSFVFLFICSMIEISPALAQGSAPIQAPNGHSQVNPSASQATSVTAAGAAPNAIPQEWTEAVRSLARKIKEAMGSSRLMTLEFQNISSISEASAAGIQSAMRDALSREHLELTAAATNEAVKVRVTCSEDRTNYIGAAEIQKGDARKVALVSVKKTLSPNLGLTPAPVLQRRIVFQQDAPILDFEIEQPLPNPNDGLEFRDVLTPTGLIRYQFQGDRLQLQLPDFAPVHITAPNSRDVRGRILRSGSQEIRFFIGGALCVAGADSNCSDNTILGWPINPSGVSWGAAYQPGRNYFQSSGIYSGEVRMTFPAFYSAAVLESGHETTFLLAGLEGKSLLFTSPVPSATFAGWGDDIVSLGQGCDSRQQILVTGTGDWTKPDSLQLYELDADHATSAGQALQFSGPITALWPGDDGKSARVVSRDITTGEYEASIVTVVCNN